MSTKVHSSRNWRITSNNGDLKRKCLLFKLGQFTSNYPEPALWSILTGRSFCSITSTFRELPPPLSDQSSVQWNQLSLCFHYGDSIPCPPQCSCFSSSLESKTFQCFYSWIRWLMYRECRVLTSDLRWLFFLNWTSLLSFIQETCSHFTSESMNSEISHPRMKTTQ